MHGLNTELPLAPGARVVIRDAEWIVKKVDFASDHQTRELVCEGVSEIVRGKTGRFLDSLEGKIQILDPAQTELVSDSSAQYMQSLLYIESLLRSCVPGDNRLYAGPHGAMDPVDYQLKPALVALAQPRQRILIADAVGLGKTLEAGILVSELIRRGRGRRILVVTLKSMLTQFQKEFWNRFTIPLVRLDSTGIGRIRSRIPASHNPFYYYDRTIISMDTLKGDLEYRNYLENATWDIIIIDECHNVADRNNSMRARLAKLLARCSDTLILLSATPHDGRAKSFASLLNMLDPTAITDSANYEAADFMHRNLVVRRFKKDIVHEVKNAFMERLVTRLHVNASTAEEAAFARLVEIPFSHAGGRDHELLRVTFEKSIFSSPAAALSSVRERVKKVEAAEDTPARQAELAGLRAFESSLVEITPERFSRYQALRTSLVDTLKWSPKKSDDRIVIFSERIETLRLLQENLIRDLRLKPEQVAVLHGGLSDTDQQAIVEQFGQELSPMRLLICSDVASEGLNLHYLCHRLIHFDIPWSLMVFAQRNGRIDRYGQEKQPEITYLIQQSRNPKIHGDERYFEILLEKDEQAYRNIGDPSLFMRQYDAQKEEDLIKQHMADGLTAEQVDEKYQPIPDDSENLLQMFLESMENTSPEDAPAPSVPTTDPIAQVPSLFPDDYAFAAAAAQYLHANKIISQLECRDDLRELVLTVPSEMSVRLKQLPIELQEEQNQFILTADRKRITAEIRRCRQDESAWPKIHYLWPLHPVFEWLIDRLQTTFGRHRAPVIELPGLPPGQVAFLMLGMIPNRKGQPIVSDQLVAVFDSVGPRSVPRVERFADWQQRSQLGRSRLTNTGRVVDSAPLQPLLKRAVEQAWEFMRAQRRLFEEEITPKLQMDLDRLEGLRRRRTDQMESRIARQLPQFQERMRAAEQQEIKQVFDEYWQWIEDSMTIEDAAWLQVVAVFVSRGSSTEVGDAG